MGIATRTSHLVAIDAVRIGSLIMTRGAGQNIPACLTCVMARIASVRPGKSWRMGVLRTDPAGAHSSLEMTGIARLRAVTAETACRLRRRLHGVTSEKVRRVGEISLDVGRCPRLHTQSLCHVVTVIAALGRMTLRALFRRERRRRSMRLVPAGSVPEIGARKEGLQIRTLMARRAFTFVPLLLMLMALKAAAHGRKRSASLLGNQTRVTADALSPELTHGQVSFVIEGDLLSRL